MSAPDTMILPTSAPAGDGGRQNVAHLLTSGTYQDSYGVAHCIYPLGYPTVWPDVHHHHHYAERYCTGTTWPATTVSSPAAERPHEVVQRALKEIAGATRALRQSAEAMGVPVDGAALEEAVIAKLRAALC